MKPSLLCLLCLASLAPILKAEPDPAYAILLQRVLSSLPTMIQTQLDGNPEQAERILTKILGDGLLGKLMSDPIQLVERFGVQTNMKSKKSEGGSNEDDATNLLWSSASGSTKKASAKGELSTSTMSPTSATSLSSSSLVGATPAVGQSNVVDEKKLAEALLAALKKQAAPTSSIPFPAEYGSRAPLPQVDFSADGNSGEYLLPTGREEFRRAPPSQRYGYGMKYTPTEQQVMDDVNREAVLAYANALRSRQTAFLATQQPLKQSDPLSWLTQQQQPVVSQESQSNVEALTPEEAIRMREILDAYDAKLGRQSQESDPASKAMPTTRMWPRRLTKGERFPDMTTAASSPTEKSSIPTSTDELVDASETLASAFEIPGQQLAQIDSECGCVPLDLKLMKGDWVQALGNTENVMSIYKGALHLMQDINKIDIKPTCARFNFENVSSGRSRNSREAKVSWTFKASETSKPLTLQGTVIETDHRTMQLQMEGPNSYKFNLPVCAQKTGMSDDGDRYSYVVLAETVGKDKCRSAHVLVRNSAAFFHERNEELINFLKTRIENDNMKPVSVVPFGKNCD